MFTKITLKVAVMFVMFSLVGCVGDVATDQIHDDTRIIDVYVSIYEPIASAEAVSKAINLAKSEGWIFVSECEGRCIFRRK